MSYCHPMELRLDYYPAKRKPAKNASLEKCPRCDCGISPDDVTAKVKTNAVRSSRMEDLYPFYAGRHHPINREASSGPGVNPRAARRTGHVPHRVTQGGPPAPPRPHDNRPPGGGRRDPMPLHRANHHPHSRPTRPATPSSTPKGHHVS
ncbi:uncharacterized protein LOC133477509 isoform X2 [Phyllopteryx taeniolatus]|uniref:uncharacterized protein LOC133477509 isoform X2 n=1 Tax=Phyllopteryx taeniolatus TaxID=161469 RepID=UPI002AD2EBFD|nr:uncharacterized protein LOC133477509 isoform X2 [Phyllopteryx taeniolatus]